MSKYFHWAQKAARSPMKRIRAKNATYPPSGSKIAGLFKPRNKSCFTTRRMLTVRETFCTFARPFWVPGSHFEWDLLPCLCDNYKVLEKVKTLLRCTKCFLLLNHTCRGGFSQELFSIVHRTRRKITSILNLLIYFLCWGNLNTICIPVYLAAGSPPWLR